MRFRLTQLKMYRPALKAVAAAFLLLVQVVAVGGLEMVHHFFHGHIASINHSVEKENDPCHRAIHHGENACHHDSHVTALEECPFCDLAVSNYQITFLSFSVGPLRYHSARSIYFLTDVQSDAHAHLPSRAPPVGA